MTTYFAIVSREDSPIYEADLSVAGKKDKEETSHLHQFILHASLDIVDERMWDTNNMHIKVVDKFNELFVAAYVTAGRTRLLLLCDTRNEDGSKQFFQEVHELYLKVLLNPFQGVNTPIMTPSFDQRVRNLARKYL
ncbi:hypothetical protein CYMTET_19258 [Cymbomonas tetramitiformis]|uniref:Trafficking protein particle complex subunit 2 n=1 Tax=Cymbomonas tetramitiformis TaxID=36881 RepID=A0AAE0L525_9CHLO|nr:hypothetical protein CYMTET_19258 [Cymbomonas tetramitiformis]